MTKDNLINKTNVYSIPCTWECFGVMEVEAESLSKAIESAISDGHLPEYSEYVMNSFHIDIESAKEANVEDD